MSDVFIANVIQDEQFGRQIAHELRSRGIRVEQGFGSTGIEVFDDNVRGLVNTARYVVVVVSGYVQESAAMLGVIEYLKKSKDKRAILYALVDGKKWIRPRKRDHLFDMRHEAYREGFEQLYSYLSSAGDRGPENIHDVKEYLIRRYDSSEKFATAFERLLTKDVGKKTDLFCLHLSEELTLSQVTSFEKSFNELLNVTVQETPEIRQMVMQREPDYDFEQQIVRVRAFNHISSIEVFVDPAVGGLIWLAIPPLVIALRAILKYAIMFAAGMAQDELNDMIRDQIKRVFFGTRGKDGSSSVRVHSDRDAVSQGELKNIGPETLRAIATVVEDGRLTNCEYFVIRVNEDFGDTQVYGIEKQTNNRK